MDDVVNILRWKVIHFSRIYTYSERTKGKTVPHNSVTDLVLENPKTKERVILSAGKYKETFDISPF